MLELETTVPLSTAHIRETTAGWLEQQANSPAPELVVYSKKEFGWFIRVPSDGEIKSITDASITARSYDLLGLLWLCRYHKAQWLELDRDAPVSDLLPRWDW